MKKLIKINLVFILFFTLFTVEVFAAEVSVSLPSTVKVGQNFEVFINANTDGKLINSIDIILDYDQNLTSFSGYKNDGAVVGIWVESPNDKNGNVSMSGIIPGGVSGLYDPKKAEQKELDSIPLARLIFTAKKEGNANFSFTKTKILEHNGAGTELAHKNIGAIILIKEKTVQGDDLDEEENIIDTEKPEPFGITFLESSIFARTPPLIIFQANDGGSGIKEYKMNEGGSAWKHTESPQIVSRGIFSRNITIRAYDFAGNFQDSSINVSGLLPLRYFLIVIILLTICCIWGYKMLKHKHESNF